MPPLVTASEWLASTISMAALGVSSLTAYRSWRWRIKDRRSASLTAYFHRNGAMAQVRLPDGRDVEAGYNIVLWNRGPGAATNVTLTAFDANGTVLVLATVDPAEFPLSHLDADARYPVPWVLEPHRRERHFVCGLSWTDPNGTHERRLPVRRGETSL